MFLPVVAVARYRTRGRLLFRSDMGGVGKGMTQGPNLLWLNIEMLALKHIRSVRFAEVEET